MWLAHNKLTGNLPTVYPTGFRSIHVDDNLLGGDLPIFPSTIAVLYLGWLGIGNRFTGTLRLTRPVVVGIDTNWITDIVIADTSAITSCILSNNPLLGNSNIALLTMCTKNGLYSPSLLGKTVSTTSIRSKSTTVFSTIIVPATIFLKFTVAFKSSSSVLIPTTISKTSNLDSFLVLAAQSQTQIGSSSYASKADSLEVLIATTTTSIQRKNNKKSSTSIQFSKIDPSSIPISNAFLTRMIVQLGIHVIILCYVLSTAPFKREFKTKYMVHRKASSTLEL